MKRFNKFLQIILTVFFITNTGFANSQKSKTFTVQLAQSGELLSIVDFNVHLKDSVFDFIFEFSEPMSLLVSASHSKKTFVAAKKGVKLEKLRGFSETGMSEGDLNEDQVVLINDKAPSCWYYDDKQNHRFNAITLTEKGIHCTRTVSNLLQIPSNNILNIGEFSKPLYLVFVSYEIEANTLNRIELQRICLKLNFINE